MGCKPLALHKQGVPAFFTDEDDRYNGLASIDREQYAVSTEKPQFALRHGVCAQGLEMAGFTQRVFDQTGGSRDGLEDDDTRRAPVIGGLYLPLSRIF